MKKEIPFEVKFTPGNDLSSQKQQWKSHALG